MNFIQISRTAKMLANAVRLYYANRSLKAFGVLLHYFGLRVIGRAVPPYVFIAPSYRCQCRCIHCFASRPGRDDDDKMGTSELKSLIDQIAQLGVLGIIFSGGEPLLRKDLPELVQHAHKAGLITRIDTNGLLLDRKHISKLKDAGVTQFGVSIDDIDPEVHDGWRGVPGTYSKAVEGIKLLREFNIPVQILTYISKKNVTAGIEKIIDLARELQVMCLQLISPMAAGRWDDAFDQLLTEEEMARVWKLKLPSFVFVLTPSPGELCALYKKSTLYVTASGDVTLCCFVPYVMGNIRDSSLEELWKRHCDQFSLEFRGDCPMNNREARESLRKYAEDFRSM